jgi:CRP/FNR family transcriptional regulator, cyclic AMP receptor protein
MTMMAESLKAVPLFAELSDRDLRRLAESMHEKSYSAGREVVTEGESGIGFFVILEGTAHVSVGGERRGELRAGNYFGEMALLDGEARSASVVAGEDLRCAGMTAWHFRPFVRDHPDVAWALLKALAKRLRATESPRG